MAKFRKPATFIKEDSLYAENYDFIKKLMDEHPKGICVYFDEASSFFRVDIAHCNQALRLEMLGAGFEEI